MYALRRGLAKRLNSGRKSIGSKEISSKFSCSYCLGFYRCYSNVCIRIPSINAAKVLIFFEICKLLFILNLKVIYSVTAAVLRVAAEGVVRCNAEREFNTKIKGVSC